MKIGMLWPPVWRRKSLMLGATLACATSLSFAQDASVLITSFSYSTTNGTTLSFFNPDTSFYTNAQNGGGVFGAQTDQFDDGDYNQSIAGVNLSNAQAAISTFDPQVFWATASSTRSANPPGTPRNQATADAFQSGDFSLDAAGTVTFVIDYMLNVSKPGGSALTDSALTTLNFSALSSDRQSGGTQSDQLMSFNQASGIGAKSGEFTINVSLLDGQVGSYTLEGVAQSFAVAAVPEPQEWALIAAGLAAVGYMRRRRAPRS